MQSSEHNERKPENNQKKLVLGDDAINNPNTDWFEFETPAASLTEQLYNVAISSGVCCGISGSWGSGKSSFMKLMETHAVKKYGNNICTAWFTAWDPGGISDIGNSMLYNFAHSIDALGNNDASKVVKDLDEALGLRKNIRAQTSQIVKLLSKVSPEGGKEILECMGSAIDELNSPKKIQQCFELIVKKLEEQNKTIFFFVDDLDRSTGEQIFDLLSELKVYVSHPRIIVVIAYDEEYVLNALKNSLPTGIDVNNYLEKIITIRRALPHATEKQLETIAASVLITGLEINEEEAQTAAGLAAELALMNPRRLKRLLLTCISSLPSDWKERRGSRSISNYLMSALLVCTASEANLLKNGAIVSVFEKGMEEDIIPALKDFSDREKSQTEVIDLLTQEIEAIRPNFVPGLVSSLRVGIISDDEPEQSNSTEPTQADPLVGWAGMVEPLLTKAIHHGFELSPIIATYQADVKIALKGERVSLADFIDIVAKDGTTKGYLSKFFLRNNKKLKFLTYTSAEMNIALMLGEITERENNMPLPNVVDAELTIEKPFIFWIIAISERVDLPMVRYIEQGRNRAQSFKHPFRLAFTSSEAINVLFSFLLTKVTEITTTPRLPAK